MLSKEYKERLRERPFRPDSCNIERRKIKLFNAKLEYATKHKTTPWTMVELDKVLSNLKINISRDQDGYINEIFKPCSIGHDLKQSILVMFNKLKSEQLFTDFMLFASITTIPKSGSESILRNQRGIFRISVLRSILMKLVFNRNYQTIDSNMSESNIGGRKGKGCRNNIFIINGIIHDVLSSAKKKPVILQIYDYTQMFDAMNLKR